VVQLVWDLCKEEREATNEVHVYMSDKPMTKRMTNKLTDAIVIARKQLTKWQPVPVLME